MDIMSYIGQKPRVSACVNAQPRDEPPLFLACEQSGLGRQHRCAASVGFTAQPRFNGSFRVTALDSIIYQVRSQITVTRAAQQRLVHDARAMLRR